MSAREKKEPLIDRVRAECIRRAKQGWAYVEAEKLAKLLDADRGDVTRALQALATEGIIGSKHGPPKFSKRTWDATLKEGERPSYYDEPARGYYRINTKKLGPL